LSDTTAGANDRAGFMLAPEIGPAKRAAKTMTEPTAIPVIIPFSFAPVGTFRITNVRNWLGNSAERRTGEKGRAESLPLK